MVKRNGVSIKVDEDFFKVFEKSRELEQAKLRKEVGVSRNFNLTQRNFTAILARKNFRFKIPKQKVIRIPRGRRK